MNSEFSRQTTPLNTKMASVAANLDRMQKAAVVRSAFEESDSTTVIARFSEGTTIRLHMLSDEL